MGSVWLPYTKACRMRGQKLLVMLFQGDAIMRICRRNQLAQLGLVCAPLRTCPSRKALALGASAAVSALMALSALDSSTYEMVAFTISSATCAWAEREGTGGHT